MTSFLSNRAIYEPDGAGRLWIATADIKAM